MLETGEFQAGFTLLETLTVLALTAAIGAIAFPSLQTAIATATLSQSRQMVMSDLLRARGLALRTGVPERLTIARGGEAYSWNGGEARQLQLGVRIQSAEGAPIAFFPDGSASAGVLVFSTGVRQLAFDVQATGAVSVSSIPAGATAG